MVVACVNKMLGSLACARLRRSRTNADGMKRREIKGQTALTQNSVIRAAPKWMIDEMLEDVQQRTKTDRQK